MARLSEQQTSTIGEMFSRYDEDLSGELDLSELSGIFMDVLGNATSIEQIDSIAAAWSADGGVGHVDQTDFIAIMSRFIRMHEHHWRLLLGFREVMGADQALGFMEDSRLTVEMLMKVGSMPLSESEALEMLWSVDWHSGGPDSNSDSTSVNFGALMAGVHVCLERPHGQLPPQLPMEPASLPSVDVADVNIAIDRRSEAYRSHERDKLLAIVPLPTKGNGFSSLDDLDIVVAEEDKEEPFCATPTSLKEKLCLFLNDPSSSVAARAWSYTVATAILLSAAVLLVSGSRTGKTEDEVDAWSIVELALTSFFFLELVARFMTTSESLREFIIKKPLNICDFIAILPSYLQAAFFRRESDKEFLVIQLLKLSWLARLGRLHMRSNLAAPVAVVLVVIWGIHLKHEVEA